jgi:hypothetical protein
MNPLPPDIRELAESVSGSRPAGRLIPPEHAATADRSAAGRPPVGPRTPSRLGPERSGRPSVLDNRHVPGDSLRASKPSPEEETTVVR